MTGHLNPFYFFRENLCFLFVSFLSAWNVLLCSRCWMYGLMPRLKVWV